MSKCTDVLLDLCAYQWSVAEDLAKVLKPFEVLASIMCAELNTSLSCVLPVAHRLLKAVQQSSNDLFEISEFKNIVCDQLMARFKLEDPDTTGLHALASFLDPRVRGLQFLDGDKQCSVHDSVLSLVASLKKKVVTQEKPGPPPKQSQATPPDCPSSRSFPWNIIGVEFDHTSLQATSERPEEELAWVYPCSRT